MNITMNRSKMILLALVAFLAGGLMFSCFPNSGNDRVFDPGRGIIFQTPSIFDIQPQRDHDYRLTLSPSQHNITAFSGQINVYPNQTSYRYLNVFDNGFGLLYDWTERRWRYFGQGGERDVSEFQRGETKNGYPIYFFQSGDAGSLTMTYVIPLEYEVVEITTGVLDGYSSASDEEWNKQFQLVQENLDQLVRSVGMATK